MSTALELFTYDDAHHVRVVRDQDGEPWFVLADLCRVLDITAVGRAAARLDEGVRETHALQTPGGPQQMTVVSEAGMYEVVIRSDKPEAARLRRWITGEVLPAIRKTGTYSRYPAQPQQLPSKKELAQWVVEAEERAEAAEFRAKALEPSAAAWDELAEAGADYAIDDAAKVLSRDPNISIGKLRLFAYMAGLGWTYRGHRSRWRAYQAQVDLGRLAEKVGKPYWCDTLEKLVTPDPVVRITSKGLAELYKRLGGGTQLTLVSS